MKRKVIFAAALLIVALATVVTFAQPTSTASVSITAGGTMASVQATTDVSTDIKLKYSTGSVAPFTHVDPTWSPVENESGSITAGDVYYIDCTSYTGDIVVTVYITNPDALEKDYAYLNMQVNVWGGESETWTQATLADSTAIGTVYLTLTNGYTSFILEASTHYCITIDAGSYYCIDTDAAGGDLSPDFYIEIRQA